MRLDRMLGITMELLTRQRVTAAGLASRFEVSIRTIYRDIELINQAGIPVVSYTGADGGFELMNGFFLTKQHFSVEDLSVIYHLLEGMDGAMGGRAASFMHKLSGLQPELLNGKHNKLIFDMSTSPSEKAVIWPLIDALNGHRVVSFSYTSASGTRTARRVEPMALYWESRAWYLEGYCLMRKARRFFRVSRLSALELTDEQFQPRDASTLPAEEENAGLHVHLRFDAQVSQRVKEQFKDSYTGHEGM